MNTWFNTPNKLAALVSAAETWRGTPWAPNSDAPGANGGVACHLLPRAVLIAVGALPADFPRPLGDPEKGNLENMSVIADFLNSRPEFTAMECASPVLAKPGDLLGFRMFGSIRHLGIALPDRQVLHVMKDMNATTNNLFDPTMSRRLVRIWRVKP